MEGFPMQHTRASKIEKVTVPYSEFMASVGPRLQRQLEKIGKPVNAKAFQEAQEALFEQSKGDLTQITDTILMRAAHSL